MEIDKNIKKGGIFYTDKKILTANARSTKNEDDLSYQSKILVQSDMI